MASGRKKRKRRGRSPAKKSGVLMGMRSGFKGLADAATGKPKSKKGAWLGTAITILLVLAAAALIMSR